MPTCFSPFDFAMRLIAIINQSIAERPGPQRHPRHMIGFDLEDHKGHSKLSPWEAASPPLQHLPSTTTAVDLNSAKRICFQEYPGAACSPCRSTPLHRRGGARLREKAGFRSTSTCYGKCGRSGMRLDWTVAAFSYCFVC